MQAQKVGFAVFFIVAVLGAVLLLISQIPLTKEGYDVIETRSFSPGEPFTFYWTFEANAKYRFEVKGENWTSTRYVHLFLVGNYTNVSELHELPGVIGPNDPPWAWDWSQGVKCVRNVTFYHFYYSDSSRQIDRATTTASVEISQLRETTYRLTYLIYVGLPVLVIGAILITITGKDADLRMRMPDTSTRANPFIVDSGVNLRCD